MRKCERLILHIRNINLRYPFNQSIYYYKSYGLISANLNKNILAPHYCELFIVEHIFNSLHLKIVVMIINLHI